MDERMKTLGLFALVGVAAGAGVAIGLGVRVLAWGAALGLGGGLAIGLAEGAARRRRSEAGEAVPALLSSSLAAPVEARAG